MSVFLDTQQLLQRFTEESDRGAWDDIAARLVSELVMACDRITHHPLSEADRHAAKALIEQLEFAITRCRERQSQIQPLLESLSPSKG